MNHTIRNPRLLATLLAAAGLALCPTADAQQSDKQQDQNRGSKGRMARDQAQGDMTGWVRIGYDLDGDGRFEAVEYIYAVDMQQAQEASKKRRGSGRTQPLTEVRGEVAGLYTQKMAGGEKPHRLARIKRKDAPTTKVDLGDVDQTKELDLDDGDRITVYGTTGWINDRPVLMASRVRSDDKTVDVGRRRQPSVKRIKGEVLSTRMAKFRNTDGESVVARVRTNSGRTATVNMGPADDLKDADIEDGSEVTLMVRPARINGEAALAAQEVRMGDKTIRIDARRKANSKEG